MIDSPLLSRWRLTRHVFVAFSIATICPFMTGCATRRPPVSHGLESFQRDAGKAEELYKQGLTAFDGGDEDKAENCFRAALAWDLFHGPAHNNLGAILLRKGELYEAAEQFEHARRLLPGHPDPRHNLAMTFELAGKTDEAITAYKAALEVYPDYLPSMMGLAHLQVKSNRRDPGTPRLLREVAMRSEDARWRDWAKLQITLIESPSNSSGH